MNRRTSTYRPIQIETFERSYDGKMARKVSREKREASFRLMFPTDTYKFLLRLTVRDIEKIDENEE